MGECPRDSTVVVILGQREEEVVGFDFVSLPEANTVSGIWNLSPGAHFMYIKSKEQDDLRLGEFVYFRKGEIKVFKRSQEETGSLFPPVEEYSTQEYKESIVMGHLKNKMSKIPQDLSQLWSNITDCINSELILKLRPINKVLRNQKFRECDTQGFESDFDSRNEKDLREATLRVELSDSEEDPSKTLEEYKDIAKNLSGFSNKVDLKDLRKGKESSSFQKNYQIDKSPEDDYSCIYYSDFPMHDSKINKFKDMTPEMVTSMYMDTSYVLDYIREGYESNKYGYKAEEYENKYFYVLGELQYCFVLFVLCFNYESLLQYKKLLRAFCNAEGVLIKNKELSLRFLKTLRYHVEIWDQEHDVYQEDDFLRHSLSNLREIILDNKDQLSHCLDEYYKVERSFRIKFGISLEDLEIAHSNLV